MIENRLKHELYSSQFLRYLYLNTPLLIYPTETVLGTDGLMDGWIAHWHSIIRGRDPPSFPPLWAFLFSPDHVMAYSVNVVKLHCLEMHRTDAYSFTRPKRWAPDLSDSIPSRAQTMTMAHMAAKAATAATAAAINCKMSLTSVVGERTKKKKEEDEEEEEETNWHMTGTSSTQKTRPSRTRFSITKNALARAKPLIHPKCTAKNSANTM